jgi:hypothetical protein
MNQLRLSYTTTTQGKFQHKETPCIAINLWFCFYQIREQEGRTGSAQGWGRGGEVAGKGVGG